MAPAPHVRAHGRHRSSRRRTPRALYAFLLAVVSVGATVAGGVHVLTSVDARQLSTRPFPAGAGSPVPEHTSAPILADARVPSRWGEVQVSSTGYLSWALLDRHSNQIIGSPNMRATDDALGMIRPWLAADVLRRQATRGKPPAAARLRQLRAVVGGDDGAPADSLYRELGGEASIRRMVKTCGLSDTRPAGGTWSGTLVSARDTVLMGACLADGRAAGARWTGWLLAEMRLASGAGDFGVRRALPAPRAATVAVRNGWLLNRRDHRWHVGCLAVDRDWALGVMTHYPAELGKEYGARLCSQVGSQLIRR